LTPAGRRLPVFAHLPQYRAALAQLSVSAGLVVDDVRGAVAVVPGSGDWWQAMGAARAGGAVALVLSDPGMLPPGAMDGSPWPADLPVIVDRPGLRADVIVDSIQARRSSPPRMVTIDCAGPAAGMAGIILDGVGWARSLIGAGLELRSGASTPGATMALLEARKAGAGMPATLMATRTGGRRPGGLIRLVAHGEVRTEVTIDQPAGLVCVETGGEGGVFRAPIRYEEPARLALRRAVEACTSGEPTPDLADLLADMAVTADIGAL